MIMVKDGAEGDDIVEEGGTGDGSQVILIVAILDYATNNDEL